MATTDGITVSTQMLTADELAALLKVSRRTIWRMRSSGQLPRPIKVGGAVRWRLADIEVWIAEGCPKGNWHSQSSPNG